MISRLDLLDRHVGFFLLNNFLCLPKLNYLLRAAPCFLISEVLRGVDHKLHQALEGNLNTIEYMWLDDMEHISAWLQIIGTSPIQSQCFLVSYPILYQ
ncbi:hypothetical protein Ciccas_002985 [Cichlidogyrus casuarinus]|uniref:Uncharacterized protein n=1 Tax=Cichlidogyrus casuarinus TaxID=1844966 RepID=A0ABD2QFM8_9PLAT